MEQKVLITGANKGIGFETAKQLGAKGWTILLGAKNEQRGMSAVEALQQQGITAEWIKIDLTDTNTIHAAANDIKANHPDVKLLINNAGISLGNSLLEDLSLIHI